MKSRQILITGATGTVGREIAGEILGADPDARLVALIRGENGPAVEARLDSLRAYLACYRPGCDLSRLEGVRGDVTLPFFGMDPGAYEALRRRIGEIVHAAASVRLNLRLSCSRATNVQGTAEVVRFALVCPGLRRLAYVSTAYVAGDRSGRIREGEFDTGQRFLNPYERSKFEAEALIRRFLDRLPITIFRPSIVVGASSDGHISSMGTIYPPVRTIGAGLIRTLPGRGELRLDLVPVDFVARAIARLLPDPVSPGQTYHLCAGRENSVPVGELLREAVRCLDGPSDPPLTFTGEEGRDGSYGGLKPFFDYLTHEKDFDNSNLYGHFPSGVWLLPSLGEFLNRLLSFCVRTNWGNPYPWETGSWLATTL